MPGSKRFRDPALKAEVTISTPAEKMIGAERAPEFVRLVMEMMNALGAQVAYVSKSGDAVEINIVGPGSWTYHMKIKRGGGHAEG